MAVKIGHSSIDERGKASGGSAGDQNGKEVCTRAWYKGGWTVLLRPKDAAVAERLAKACEAGCANANIGYDQGQRNTLHDKAKATGYDLSKITAKCECDCSSFATVCAIAAGVDKLEYTGNAPTTSSMRSKFVGAGAFDALTDSKYLGADTYLRRGDVLVKSGSHTVIVLENGSAAAEKYGKAITVTLHQLSKGNKGEEVRALQILLMGRGYDVGKDGADGEFGENTRNAVIKYQRDNGLAADGIAGKDTLTALWRG